MQLVPIDKVNVNDPDNTVDCKLTFSPHKSAFCWRL